MEYSQDIQNNIISYDSLLQNENIIFVNESVNQFINTGSKLEHFQVEEEYSKETNSLHQLLQSWDLGFLFERFLGK